MKRSLLLGVAAVVVGLCGFQAMAQDTPPAGRQGAGADARANRPDAREAQMDRLFESLQLTADQASKVKQMLQTFKQANENWMKEHGQELKDAQEKIAAARKDGKPEDVKAAREAMEKIQATRKDLADGLKKQLADVPLTAEQVDKIMAQMAPPMAPRPAMRMLNLLRQLNLTPDQQAQARKIVEQAQADAEKADTPAAKEEIAKAALEKIKTDVLNDEQRKLLDKLEKLGPAAEGLADALGRLKLTDEQWGKAKAIWEEDAKKPQPGENRREARREVLQKIAEEVLTPEQRQEFKKLMDGAFPASAPASASAAAAN